MVLFYSGLISWPTSAKYLQSTFLPQTWFIHKTLRGVTVCFMQCHEWVVWPDVHKAETKCINECLISPSSLQ